MNYLGLPLEIWEEILFCFENISGLLRCVNSQFKDLIDASKRIKKPRESKLSHCFESDSLFKFAYQVCLKNAKENQFTRRSTRCYTRRFTEKDVRVSILIDKFKTSLDLVFNLVPIEITTMKAIAQKDRIDLLEWIETHDIFPIDPYSTKWQLKGRCHHDWTKLMRFAFVCASEKGFDAVERIATKYTKRKQPLTCWISDWTFDFNSIDILKQRLEKYPSIFDYFDNHITSSTFSLEDWIHIHSFVQKYHVKVSYNFDFDATDLDDDQALLEIQQIMGTILKIHTLYQKSKKMQYVVFKKLLIPCHNNNLMKCVRSLLFDFEVFKEIPRTSGDLKKFKKELDVQSKPVSLEYMEFLKSISSAQQFLLLKVSKFNNIMERLLYHDQADLISDYFFTNKLHYEWDDEWGHFVGQYFNIVEKFIRKKPIRALTHPNVTTLFIKMVSQSYWQVYWRETINEDIYHHFESLFQAGTGLMMDETRFRFTCLLHHSKMKDDYHKDVRLKIMDGTYGSVEEYSHVIQEWLLSIFPKPCEKQYTQHYNFTSFENLEQYFPHVLAESKEPWIPYLWRDLFPTSIDLVTTVARFLKKQKIPFVYDDHYLYNQYWEGPLSKNVNFLLFLVQEIKMPLLRSWILDRILATLKRENQLELLPIFMSHFTPIDYNESHYCLGSSIGFNIVMLSASIVQFKQYESIIENYKFPLKTGFKRKRM
jgi:hypothetical protein